MATRPKNSEAALLEQYRVALENAEQQSVIAKILAEFGYTPETLAEGKAIYAATRQAFDSNKKEDDETSVAYNNFMTKKQQLADLYSLHRKKAKVVFRNDAVTCEKLGVTGSIPQAYIKWMERVKKFYATALTDNSIQQPLTRLNLQKEELTNGNYLISEVESARAVYVKERGESEDATKIKDSAFIKLDDWMSEFYAVARIALEDSPQLLEVLGKSVKS